MSQKVSIRFYKDSKVRGVWDDEHNKWFFSVLDIIGAINEQEDYQKNRNYWKYLKAKLKKEQSELVSATTQLKLMAADGKRYKSDAVDHEGVIELAKSVPNNKAMAFLDWFTYSDNSIDGQSRKKAYTFWESNIIADEEIGTVKALQKIHAYIFGGLYDFAGQKQSNWIARPQLTMSYDFGKGWFWKYKGYVSGYQPSLSQLSDITQQIDKYQMRRGNPNLRSVMYVSNEMELSWQSKHVNLNLWANYSYDHKPIMEETFEEIINGSPYAIRMYDNQRGYHKLNVSPSVQVKLLDNKLMFNVTPFVKYMVSQGNNYNHEHVNYGVRGGIFYLLKGWRFYADVVAAQHNLWGETLTLGELTHDIGINYNSEHFGFGIMMVNPFSPHGSRTVTKDLSALAPTSNTAVMQNYRQVLMLNFNVNLDFGTKHNEGWKRIDNEDTESGILSGSK